MATSNAIRALPSVWLRFTDVDDQKKYGEGWYEYDESWILIRPARDLIRLETELGMPLVSVMNGFRDSTALGDTAAAWIAIRDRDPIVAGPFDQFNPIIMQVEWSKTDPTPVGKARAERDTSPKLAASDSPTAASYTDTTPAPTDTVALQNMPLAE